MTSLKMEKFLIYEQPKLQYYITTMNKFLAWAEEAYA